MRHLDPLIRAAKKARAVSEVGKLEALIEETKYWKRRETIAKNKLSAIRVAVYTIAANLAKEVDERRLRDEVLP